MLNRNERNKALQHYNRIPIWTYEIIYILLSGAYSYFILRGMNITDCITCVRGSIICFCFFTFGICIIAGYLYMLIRLIEKSMESYSSLYKIVAYYNMIYALIGVLILIFLGYMPDNLIVKLAFALLFSYLISRAASNLSCMRKSAGTKKQKINTLEIVFIATMFLISLSVYLFDNYLI